MVVLSDVRVSRLEILDLRLAGYVRYTILATSDAVVDDTCDGTIWTYVKDLDALNGSYRTCDCTTWEYGSTYGARD